MEPSEPRVLHAGQFLRLIRRGSWEYVQRPTGDQAVAIVAVTAANELLLVEQFRLPVDQAVIELPAGLVGDLPDNQGIDTVQTARNELLEETGHEAGAVRLLTAGPPSAGLASEIVSFFLAEDLVERSSGGGVHGENITVHRVPLASIDTWLANQAACGRLIDPKIYAGLYFLMRQQGDWRSPKTA